MNRLQKAAVLASLVEKLRERGNWTGETHVQKAVFFLQELFACPLEFEFILYKHGPFSFDLRDELASLRADGILVLEPQAPPYGPKLSVTSHGREFARRYPGVVSQHQLGVDFVADFFGDRGVGELEALATALYVTRIPGQDGAVEARSQCLHDLKPHIPLDKAREAVASLDMVAQRAASLDSRP